MMSEVQSRKIKKYKKFAKKNIICRYIAAILIVINILFSDLKRHHKGMLITMGQLACLCIVFICNTSFAPANFHTQEEGIPVSVTEEAIVIQETTVYDDTEELTAEDALGEETQQTLAEEDVAGLEDLMAQNEKINSDGNVQENQTTNFSKDDWNLLLINKQHTIPDDYTFSLGTIKGSMKCDERIIEPLTDMFAAAKADGITLVVCSPYRDMSRQEYLFDRKMKSYMSSGYSYMEAYKKASVTVTVPGASEHQVGLAMDIICSSYSSLDEGFGDTDAGIWLKEHSAEYGFILRYPKGKEMITGIVYEPWHYRYVGKEAAQVITRQNLTLEEFIENL